MATYDLTNLDSSAVILTNLMVPSSFSLSKVTLSDGVYTFASGSSITAMLQQKNMSAPTANHKYYGRCYQKRPSGSTFVDGRFEYYITDSTTGVMTFTSMSSCIDDNEWHLHSAILSLSSPDSGTWKIRSFTVNGSAASYRKEMMVIDLTAAFGEGNEPTQSWCDSNIPYFEGSIIIIPSLQSGDIINCPYSGEIKGLSIPAGLYYQIECWGAKGYSYSTTSGVGGNGGYTSGNYHPTESKILYLVSGGRSYNGGGSGYNGGSTTSSAYTGGGATHIATQTGLLSTLSTNTSSILAVAGGGGGGVYSETAKNGGNGGGISGEDGDASSSSYSGKGGTQTSGGTSPAGTSSYGSFGQGGASIPDAYTSYYCGGGGGGFYGGGGPFLSDYGSGGSGGSGGGSGYISTDLTNAQTSQESNSSNPDTTNYYGYIRITISSHKPPEIYDFSYTGSVQTITLSKGQYKLECWGAQGGSYKTYYGGAGGYSVGTLSIDADTDLYLYVGGQPVTSTESTATNPGGFNGGGNGQNRKSSSTSSYGAAGGGGTDIRIGTDSLYSRVIVAGGGGGSASIDALTTKYGGGTSGGSPSSGYGATQTSAGTNGSFGQGADAPTDSPSSSSYTYGPGGGGGGWYGGGAISTAGSSTYLRDQNGGGSGYVYTSNTSSRYPSGCLLNSSYYLTSAQIIAGNAACPSISGGTEIGHIGNGYIRITEIIPKNKLYLKMNDIWQRIL